MKSEFIQPRFSGRRFSENTLPLEVARDLVAYEVLIVELAKHLYLQDHPDRQRLPKGFSSDFHLHIERIDGGSAKPMLALVSDPEPGLFEAPEAIYFNQARDLLSECIAANDAALPTRFPKALLSHFNRFGRSLRDDEVLELPRGVGLPVARLTPERRKHLVLAADRVYEREVELQGSIGEADWERSTFRLRLVDGTTCTIPMPESFNSRAREFGGRSRHQVTVKGIAAYDSYDRLQRVISVESIDVQRNQALASRFDELAELQDGWHNGTGIAPNKDRLEFVARRLTDQYPESLPLPIVVPTQDGNLLLEWSAEGDPSLDLDLTELSVSYHAFADDRPDVEREFLLNDESAWSQLFAFLGDQLRTPTV